jgi:hypothetical protein
VYHQILPPRNVFGEFMDSEIAHARLPREPTRSFLPACGVMGSRCDVVVVRQIVNAFGLQQTARFGDIQVYVVAAL